MANDPDTKKEPGKQEPGQNQPKPSQPEQSENKPRFGEGKRRGQGRDSQQSMNGRRQRGQTLHQRFGQPPRKEETPKNTATYACAICGKPIFDLASALGSKENNEPVHFDCALEKVTADEKLAENEKIVYLGAGFFGVVVYKNGKDGAFTVSRKIRWEGENDKLAWRKEISSNISKL
ncbi:MAG: hypothetical protein LLF89_07120 [Spirochaetaceae bacterium]|nr:hypothetical protein [Spirochaetaceae bacterium]